MEHTFIPIHPLSDELHLVHSRTHTPHYIALYLTTLYYTALQYLVLQYLVLHGSLLSRREEQQSLAAGDPPSSDPIYIPPYLFVIVTLP